MMNAPLHSFVETSWSLARTDRNLAGVSTPFADYWDWQVRVGFRAGLRAFVAPPARPPAPPAPAPPAPPGAEHRTPAVKARCRPYVFEDVYFDFDRDRPRPEACGSALKVPRSLGFDRKGIFMMVRHALHGRCVRGTLAGALSLFILGTPEALRAQDGNSTPASRSTPGPAATPAGATPSGTSTPAGAPTPAGTSTPADPQEEPPKGFIAEPKFITRGIDFAVSKMSDTPGQRKNGFYPEFSNTTTGSGWLSVGPGYRRNLFDNRAFVDTSAAVSWHLFKVAQARFEAPELHNNKLTVGIQGIWRDDTQLNYFGFGPDSLEANESQYRIKSTDLVGYAAVRPREWLSIGDKFGWLFQPTVENPGGTFKKDVPSTLQEFPNEPGVSPSAQPNFLHNQAAIAADTRDYPGHPTSGGLYRVAATSYWDRESGTFSFNEYEAEALQMVPMDLDKRWVIGLRVWTLVSDVPVGHEIPIYLQPALGGQNTLRSYSNYRFHDRDLLLLNAESRWALFTHVDGAIFMDAGNVASRASRLNLDKTSFGAGLRLHTKQTTFARLDVAHGSEGWRVLARTSDPLRLSRIRRRAADVPFTP
jgi:Omp85 superfamily domain